MRIIYKCGCHRGKIYVCMCIGQCIPPLYTLGNKWHFLYSSVGQFLKGTSTLYKQCNFGTVTEHNTTCSIHTNKVNQFWCLDNISLSQKRSLSSFPFLFWAALILAFDSMATSLVLTPCSVCRTCVKWGEKVIFFTWQVRPQLGNVLYTAWTHK